MELRQGTGVVITQWRDHETTEECLKYLRALDQPPLAIVVVDNESQADVRVAQEKHHPDVTFIGLSRNEGHPAAVNLGAHLMLEKHCEFILLLDNDAFLTPACLGILEAALRNEPLAAAATPLILSGRRPGLVWYGGGRISMLGNSVHENMWKPADGVDRSKRTVRYATSCVLLVRALIFEKIGGFDASLYAYTDDLEFSYRVRHQGRSLLYVPTAEATHGESVNVIKVAGKHYRDYYTMRNRLLVVWKHGTMRQKLAGIPLSIIWYGFGYAFLFLLRGEMQRASALLKGIADFIDGRTGKGNL
jgi:GT2 family glycosyltransferase